MVGRSAITLVLQPIPIPRLQRSKNLVHASWGVAPGFAFRALALGKAKSNRFPFFRYRLADFPLTTY